MSAASLSFAEPTPLEAVAECRSEMNALVGRYVHREYDPTGDEWAQIVGKCDDKIRAAHEQRLKRPQPGLRRRLFGLLHRDDPIDRLWDKQWRDNIRLNREYFSPAGAAADYAWNDRALKMRNAGGTLARILQLAATIDVLRPRTVLEVGSGDGLNLIVLASLFPDVAFTGIELTQGGVEVARRFQSEAELPEELAAAFPRRRVDGEAFRKVVFLRGSAKRLRVPTASFDLVLTCVALEQMEAIRRAALSEVARAARGWTAMIEPFREYNADGMRRRYIEAYDYFQGTADELPRYGLEPRFVSDDVPQKLNLHTALVVCRKR